MKNATNMLSFCGKIINGTKVVVFNTACSGFESKIYCLLAGTLSLEKKSLHFWIKPTLDLSQKYIKCFGGKNCALCSLTRQKNGYILTFDKALFKIAEFFFLFGTLHSQITFWLISRPLLKAHIFFTWFVKKTQ